MIVSIVVTAVVEYSNSSSSSSRGHSGNCSSSVSGCVDDGDDFTSLVAQLGARID